MVVSFFSSKYGLQSNWKINLKEKKSCSLRRHLSLQTRCASGSVKKVDHQAKAPHLPKASCFAPATIANLGPGFDWLGCAVEGDGDIVIAKPSKQQGVHIELIEGDGGKLSLDANHNCVGIAALETMKLIGSTTTGVSLTLKKGLPLGSGLGSSAASAAASAWAVNCLFGKPLSKEELIHAGLKSEETVSGYHADNIAPAILGGFILIESIQPLKLTKLSSPGSLTFALVTPKFQAPTAKMRAALPSTVPIKHLVHNSCMSGLLVHGLLTGDLEKIGYALNSDHVIERARGPLIPGFQAVKKAAVAAGAFGCTISGAGPTILAVVENEALGHEVLHHMMEAFREVGNLNIQKSQIVGIDNEGAKLIS